MSFPASAPLRGRAGVKKPEKHPTATRQALPCEVVYDLDEIIARFEEFKYKRGRKETLHEYDQFFAKAYRRFTEIKVKIQVDEEVIEESCTLRSRSSTTVRHFLMVTFDLKPGHTYRASSSLAPRARPCPCQVHMLDHSDEKQPFGHSVVLQSS